MTSSDSSGLRGPCAGETPHPRHAELLAEGWQRCFIADEPRLSESVATYRELGFDVQLLPVPAEEGACTECMRQAPDRFRLIYIRKNHEDDADSC